MNTIAARLRGGDGGPVAVIGQGEGVIRLPAPAGVDPRWLGREVVLGIRPECIAEPSRRFGEDAAASLLITAPVELTEPTGAETIVVLRVGDEKLLARVAPDTRLGAGEMAQFAVDTRKICLFDPATERLIA